MSKKFPKGFKFGWSQAGFQSEMGSKNSVDDASDWYVWVHDKENISSGLVSGDFPDDGPGYWENYENLHRVASDMNLKLARVGVEWSRIFPLQWPETLIKKVSDELPYLSDSSFKEIDKMANQEALKRYMEIFQDLNKKDIDLIVNFYHWPIPSWLSDPISVHKGKETKKSGWLNNGIINFFAAYSAYMANKLDKFAFAFSTMNEPNVVYSNGYLNVKSGFPPSFYSKEYADLAKENIIKANALAYDAVKKQSDKTVGIIYANTSFTKIDGSVSDDIIEKLYEDSKWSFFDPLIKGSKELGISGRKLDWIGINYYTRTMIGKIGDNYGVTQGYGHSSERNSVTQDGRPTSDFGWEFYPEGLEDNIMRYWERYSLPLYITENGIADEADYQRSYYLVSHISSIHRAIEKGADVRGYLHWSLLDNYEWSSGFSQKFGLIGFDRKTKKFQIRPSALLYSEIAKHNGIKEEYEHLDRIPPVNGLHR